MNTTNKEILNKANNAFAEGKLEDFLALCTADVVMRWPGSDQVWTGQDAIRTNMGPMMAGGPQMKINVVSKMAEGDLAMGHGTMEMKRSDGTDQSLWFSDVYHFHEGKIAEVVSYMVGLDQPAGGATPESRGTVAPRHNSASQQTSAVPAASYKATIVAVNRAFENGNLEDFLALCTPDVSWTMAGMGTWDGADTIRQMWNGMMGSSGDSLPRISVHDMIVEGDHGMGDGTVECTKADGSEQTMFYCDVYRFSDGKVAELISYCVEPKPQQAKQTVAAEMETA